MIHPLFEEGSLSGRAFPYSSLLEKLPDSSNASWKQRSLRGRQAHEKKNVGGEKLSGCLHGGRKILALERSLKVEQLFVALHAEISAEVVTKRRRKRRKIVSLYQLHALLPPCLFFLSLVLGYSE